MRMDWSYKELVLLLVLCLIVVPLGIEMGLQGFLESVLHHNLYAGTLTGLVMAIVFTLGVYFIALRPKQLSWRAVGLQAFPKRYWKWIFFWTVIHIVVSVLVLIVMDFFHIGVDNSKTASLKADLTWFTFGIGFLSAAIISPVYEEIFYRGFLYKWFKMKWGMGVGIMVSASIFTLVHIPTYNTLPVNFIGGVIYAWTYERTGSIVPGIIIHGLFNGIAVILTAFA